MKREHKTIRLVVWLLVLCMLTAGAVLGKYVSTTTPTTANQVEFTVELAKKVILRETKAVRQTNGSYRLSTTENDYEEVEQKYILMPGVDIPKDPHIVIEGKTDLPAYLFLEVKATVTDSTKLNDALSYPLADCWKVSQLKQPTGNDGRVMYVYSDANGLPLPLSGEVSNPIYILKDNKVYVSQKLLTQNQTASISFTVYLEETEIYADSDNN